MPTYDYECPKCKKSFEIFQKMSDERIKKCPNCGSDKIKRLIGSGMGIIFKGSGFYETDYKRKEIKTSKKSKSKVQDACENKSCAADCPKMK